MTPTISEDGSDLAAALQTIIEIGDRSALFEIVEQAFPGCELEILANDDRPERKSPRYTELSVALSSKNWARPLLAQELSDGTLKFLCLTACLLSPRPAPLIALNEPEASLHPDLLPALARLIVNAVRFSQVWVTTHSPQLADQITAAVNVQPIRLQLVKGETCLCSGE